LSQSRLVINLKTVLLIAESSHLCANDYTTIDAQTTRIYAQHTFESLQSPPNLKAETNAEDNAAKRAAHGANAIALQAEDNAARRAAHGANAIALQAEDNAARRAAHSANAIALQSKADIVALITLKVLIMSFTIF
jgi:hypothetical protein